VVPADESIDPRLERRDDVDLPALAPLRNCPEVLVIVGGGDENGLGPLVLCGTNGGLEEAEGVSALNPMGEICQLSEGACAGIVPPAEASGTRCVGMVEEKVVCLRHVNREPRGLGMTRRCVDQLGAGREGAEVGFPEFTRRVSDHPARGAHQIVHVGHAELQGPGEGEEGVVGPKGPLERHGAEGKLVHPGGHLVDQDEVKD
jgi:hypothetical protein